MAVDITQFETIEEIDKHYRRALSRADEDEEPGIRAELADAKIRFYERRAQQSELKLARAEALEKFPLAKGFEDLVTGNDAAEILNSAKRVHERFEAIKKDETEARSKAEQEKAVEDEAARTAYGSPAGAGGGTTQAQPEVEERMARTRAKLQRGDGLANDRVAANEYINKRFRDGVYKSKVEGSSYSSNSPTPRYGGDPNDPRYQEAKRRS